MPAGVEVAASTSGVTSLSKVESCRAWSVPCAMYRRTSFDPRMQTRERFSDDLNPP